MKYEPRPIDTTGVTLAQGVLALTELLAGNAHDTWAQQRLAEGWKYGQQRDDAKKEHPCLVPYEELPESEKQYDRNAAIETLKAILALGYRIEPPAPKASAPADSLHGIVAGALERLKGPGKLDLAALASIWESVSSLRWAGSSEVYELLGNRILKVGEPLLAYDVLGTGLEHWPGNVRLRQLLALALARSGATHRANGIVLQLYHQGHTDGETLGILARTHKDLWEQATQPAERNKHLQQAHLYYERGFRLAVERGKVDDAIYTGINAATTALLSGQDQLAKSLARKVRELSLEKLQTAKDYWAEATLGEAAIILGDWAEAEDRYARGGELGRGYSGDLSATRRQVHHLLQHLGQDRHRFDHCFAIPVVLVFAGHMIDQPGRPKPRFPPALEERVRREIADRLRRHPAKIGYSGAACGSDILFLEEMQRQGAEVQVVLPFPRDEFQKASVDILPGANWGKRFKRVLEQAAGVSVASEHRASGSAVAYEYSNLIQTGLARLRAQMLDSELIPLVVWDGRPGDGAGGTASLVSHWRSHSLEPEVVDTTALVRAMGGVRPAGAARKPVVTPALYLSTTPAAFPQKIMPMLFADVVHYSKLTEEQIPRFIEHFMGGVAKLIPASRSAPLSKNTWGDALYFVFSSVKRAGNLALDLCDWVSSTNWEKKGLPKGLNLRIALHAGPIYHCEDPLLKKRSYTGSHVSRAARIEPITPPGQVYASQPFAALVAAEGVKEFVCDYVGQVPLAKGYGTFPTYHIRRAQAD